jgi:hypothetical protein
MPDEFCTGGHLCRCACRLRLTLRKDWRMRAAMDEPNRVMATVTSYDEFVAAIRQWIGELGTNYECIGEIAGLPTNYLNTLLVSTPIRSFSRMSLAATPASVGPAVAACDRHGAARGDAAALCGSQPHGPCSL